MTFILRGNGKHFRIGIFPQFMQLPQDARLICLSNVFDQQYHDVRGEPIDRCLSAPKRRDLFRCLELATNREVVILSVPFKARDRRDPRWLPATRTRFSTHQQYFCANLDAPKVRIPCAWLTYAIHVLRHTRSGDVLVIDNFELVYVLAARFVRLFRRVTCILDFEDGKHLIDRSWQRLFSRTAEFLGKPLIRAAILAHPRLGERLAKDVPTEIVPGFIEAVQGRDTSMASPVRFVYSGSLDSPRGVDLLLESLPYLPASGWHLDITGAGPLEEKVQAVVNDPRWAGLVEFHNTLPPAEYNALVTSCDVGLNCQRSSNPISDVTFPSKIFSYLSAGLLVLSSRASEVESVCGRGCRYFDEEKSASLAIAMTAALNGGLSEWRQQETSAELTEYYSISATAKRLTSLFRAAKLV